MARGGPAQGLGITAAQDRWIYDGSGPGVGVIGTGDLKVTSGLGMASSIAAGRCRIRGTNALGGNSGMYHLANDSPLSRTHESSDGTNPRVDCVVACVVDLQEQGSPISEDIVILKGLATAGADLANRNGAPLIPINALLLADVLVPFSASNSALFSYEDRRQSADEGRIPQVRVDIEQVLVRPLIGRSFAADPLITSGATPTMAVLCHIPRRITATKIRWTYRHGVTAQTGNYNLGIYDASGRKVVETGVVALTGIAQSIQQRSEAITTTTFEAGMYYVMVGWASMGAGSFRATCHGATTTSDPGFPGPNYGIYSTTSGTTLPQTMLSMTDYNTTPQAVLVPAICLSA